MKTYKTWEVIKMLSENPKLKFRLVIQKVGIDLKDTFLQSAGNGYLTIIEREVEKTAEGNIGLDDEWTLIQEPVPFMEAIKALNEGKGVYCKIDSGKLYYKSGTSLNGYYAVLDEFGGPISTKEILKGKWYIEED